MLLTAGSAGVLPGRVFRFHLGFYARCPMNVYSNKLLSFLLGFFIILPPGPLIDKPLHLDVVRAVRKGTV